MFTLAIRTHKLIFTVDNIPIECVQQYSTTHIYVIWNGYKCNLCKVMFSYYYEYIYEINESIYN